MNEAVDVLLRFIEQRYSQRRHHEDQRATITGVIFVIAAAIQGALAQMGFNKNALTLTFTLIILGIFGVIASAKLSQKCSWHDHMLARLFQQLDGLVPELQVQDTYKLTRKDYEKHHKLLLKIHAHDIWAAVNLLIALLGIVYTIVIIFK
ncbi:hypothetical protein [Dictyobacter kobayashii]|uniref:Uncharacterized protein n=1 Tax=Dictyobacter kobayashii TaxID=2014872 RepID=A0A402ALT0_9CHLR|nr:hypothetical protein [Dictyobacter kobayashii]GCE20107.1 hypothetical protein KDK_39070 [Dictyobacter kobayashii]